MDKFRLEFNTHHLSVVITVLAGALEIMRCKLSRINGIASQAGHLTIVTINSFHRRLSLSISGALVWVICSLPSLVPQEVLLIVNC